MDGLETRTIGELRTAGYDGIRITCPGCQWIVITWWRLLGVRDDLTFPDLVRRLKCQRCGAKPGSGDVRLHRPGEEAPKRMF